MVPKPPILLDLSDAFSQTAGKSISAFKLLPKIIILFFQLLNLIAEHFNQLLRRYGSPVIVLNLVKKREKKKHESLLTDCLKTDINYLNQFLPPQHQIQYIN